MDLCKYVDVFYGNGAVDHFAEDGLASKWFYIKALCGNTFPHAVYPFGKMSAGVYSGGYPTGYGTHFPNSCGGIQKLGDKMKVRGVSHLHQSGTGAIGYYYNYAITTPFYGELENIDKYYELEEENAKPGYYAAKFNNISCELTVDESTAMHRYCFEEDGGRIAVDFSNDGILRQFGPVYSAYVKDAEVEKVSTDEVLFSGILSGVKLYFCVKAEGQNVRSKLFDDTKELCEDKFVVEDTTRLFGALFDFDGKEVIVKVSFSTVGYEQARKNVTDLQTSFEETAKKAYDIWNKHLSVIEIETGDEELKEKFYSNLYHSIIKPSDMTGENILGVKDDLVSELATIWDQYKTLYPLIYMVYPEMGEKIVKTFTNISRAWGKIPCSFGLTDIFKCEEQAKMLGILALCDAYHGGMKAATPEIIEECIKRELKRDDFKIFFETGVFERYTHILDTTDACLAVADITNDEQLKAQLLELAKNWTNAYAEDALMSEKSPYYEGDRYTYSFRLQKNMEERIELAGGKEKFVKMLDDFFGFGKESLKQLTYVGANKEIAESRHHRFEGFNNECDMETPYAYIYAGRHDRTCEIVQESVYKSFTTGKGGLPGNNDSGGLTSCFVWNVLGLFPASGCGEFLLSFPCVDKAVIHLSNGNQLEIEVVSNNDTDNGIKTVEFNGQEITDYRIRTQSLMEGGKLRFYK